jgi:GTP-binding protein
MELGQRRAVLKEQFANASKAVTKLVYTMPTRALLGMRNILLTNTKGTIVMNSLVVGYQPVGTALQQLRNGVLISYEAGVSTPYALQNAEARGTTFIGPAEKVKPSSSPTCAPAPLMV